MKYAITTVVHQHNYCDGEGNQYSERKAFETAVPKGSFFFSRKFARRGSVEFPVATDGPSKISIYNNSPIDITLKLDSCEHVVPAGDMIYLPKVDKQESDKCVVALSNLRDQKFQVIVTRGA
jgi:hypothetical protein